MSGEAEKFTLEPGMTIDTPICTVGLKLYTFGDCLKLVAKVRQLEKENEHLNATIDDLEEKQLDEGQ